MKRPGTVWLYSVFVFLGILFTLASSVPVLINPYGFLGVSTIEYYATIFSLILTIPEIIFIYLFFNLKKTSLTWLYISFGLSVLVGLIGGQWFMSVLTAGFGWVIWDYISHKKVNDQNLFT